MPETTRATAPDGSPACSALSVRPAVLEDAAALARIYAPYVLTSTATFEVVPPDAETMRARLAPMLGEGYPALVAEAPVGAGGALAVVGYAYAGPYHKRAAYRPTVENAVYVDPECRRGGVGRALMTRLMAEAEAAGFRQMMAVISDRANTASLGFHERLGFRRVATLEAVGHKFGRWLDVFFYQKTLGEGQTTPPPVQGPAAPDGPPTFR